MTEFVFQSESEVLEFFSGPKNGAFFLGARLTVKNAIFGGPVSKVALGI
jgi:hypothetical protein